MKFEIESGFMRLLRWLVVRLEKLLKVRISRFPLEKFYAEFVELANLELVSQSNGVLHIGAHLGLEAEDYSSRGKPAIFIEADHYTFTKLEQRISRHSEQIAFNYLLGDEEKVVKFFRSSNSSQSSSVFAFSQKNAFLNVTTTDEIEIQMSRLDAKFSPLDLEKFDHWVIDVQGAELLVLRGSGDLLKICKTLFIECSTEEFYAGGARWEEILHFMRANGFKFFVSPGNLTHLNVIFFKNSEF